MSAQMIDEARLGDMALGGAVLGTGGGGDPYVGRLLAQEAIRRHGPVRMIALDDLADDALVVPIAMMGAPTVMGEKLAAGGELMAAFDRMEQIQGRPIDAVICAEAGGLNSVTPFIAAAERGIPVVDGDGIGRALPELQMSSFALEGATAAPMVMVDDHMRVQDFTTPDNAATERFAREAVVRAGGSAMIAFYPMTGALAKRGVIPGTLSLAERLGAIVADGPQSGDVAARLAEVLGGRRLFEGRVTDVNTRTEGGFSRGTAVIEGLGSFARSAYRIDYQNEFLVAQEGDRALCMTPDLIIALDRDTGMPVPTDALRYGLRLTVLGAPADPRWHAPEGLALTGPRAFGYPFDHQPFALSEDRNA